MEGESFLFLLYFAKIMGGRQEGKVLSSLLCEGIETVGSKNREVGEVQ